MTVGTQGSALGPTLGNDLYLSFSLVYRTFFRLHQDPKDFWEKLARDFFLQANCPMNNVKAVLNTVQKRS